MSRPMLAAACLALAMPAVGCDDSSCGDALAADEVEIGNLCGSDTGTYPHSTFCTLCVASGYFSMVSTGAGACVCQTLTYNQAACAFPTSSGDRRAAAAAAIDYADMTCNSYTIPGTGDATTIAPIDSGAEAQSSGNADGSSDAADE